MTDGRDLDGLVETKDQLVEHLSKGMKPRDQWLIGTEHEKFAFQSATVLPVEFEGAGGIEALLQRVLEGPGAYSGLYEADRLIGLKCPSACGRYQASISLEPGGQFELSGAPLQTVHQTGAELSAHLRDVGAAAKPLGLDFLGLGYSPKFALSATPQMPKGRYDVMRAYMPKVGSHGLEMMHCTATMQVNLDFETEADMVKKFRVALALQPLSTALFANSVFKEGRLNGYHSYRSRVWLDVDAARTGLLPFVFEEDMGFESYVDYALQVPMYFIYRDGRYLNSQGGSFADFMAGRIDVDPDIRPTLDDWDLHLTTLFPEVRLKQFLEMRGADCGAEPFILAHSAFWVGLLYHEAALDAAFDLVKDWDEAARHSFRTSVPELGLKSRVGRYSVLDVAKEVAAMAEEGLRSRARLNEEGASELVYLEPVLDILSDGWAQSDKLIDRFQNVWGGDVHQLYQRESFFPEADL